MILVTGGTGFIGVNIAEALLAAGERVVLTAYGARVFRPSFLLPAIEDGRCFIEALDASNAHDVVEVVRKHDVTGVVHLVQSTGANSLAEEFRANLGSLLNVLEAARQFGVRRVCMASSINVYDGLEGKVFSEDATVPLGLGDAGFSGTITSFKKMEEVFAGYYAARSGLEIIAMRFGHVWGPVNNGPGVMARIVRAAAKGKPGPEPAPAGEIDHASDGRDYVYVKDVALAVQRLTLAERLRHNAYNIGSGAIVTNEMVAAAVRELIPEARLDFDPRPRPEKLILSYGMEIGRISSELGYSPRSLDDAVADYIGWLVAGNAF
jgi:UDP-glucose 4-epimerase